MKLAYYFLPSALLLMQISSVSADDSMWNTRLTLNGQAGTVSYGQADIMQPLVYDDESLFYLNGSALTGAQSMRTYSLGLGYRQIMDDNYILGGYTFFDRTRPPQTDGESRFFSQVTIGGEVLSNTWDFRANAYLPVGNNKLNSDVFYGPVINGHTVSVHDDFSQITALTGADVEAGRTIPNLPGLRTYLGFYHFDASGDDSVNGARARLEYKINNMFTLTASDQYDNNHHNEALIGARLSFGGVSSSDGLSGCADECIEDRMEDLVIRQPSATTVKKAYPTTLYTDPRSYFYVNNTAAADGNGTYEHPYQTIQQALAAANGNSVIYTYQGNGVYDLNGQINLQPGLYFTGSGGDYYYQGVKIFGASGAPILNGRINVASGDTLSNFTLDGSNTGENIGIYGNNVNNVTLSNLTVTNFSGANGQTGTNGTNGQAAYGIQLTNSSNISLDNVVVSNINAGAGGAAANNNLANTGTGGSGGNAVGVDLDNDNNVTVANTTVTNVEAGNGGNGGSMDISAITTNNAVTAGNGAAGGNAVGLSLVNTTNANVNNTTINNITAGNGGTGGSVTAAFNSNNNRINDETGGAGGAGGNAVGIDLTNAQAPLVNNVNINGVFGGSSVGGAASQSTSSQSSNPANTVTGGAGAAGGSAIGINLTNSQTASIHHVNINTVVGGLSQGGNASTTDINNSYINGGNSAAGGNATGIQLAAAKNATVTNASVSNLTGGNSTAGIAASVSNDSIYLTATGGNAANGGNATAIDLTGANTVSLSNINVSNLIGGTSRAGFASAAINTNPNNPPKGTSQAYGGDSGNGGNAIGINKTGAINLNLDLPSFSFVNLTGGNAIAGIGVALGGIAQNTLTGIAGTSGIAANTYP